MKNIFFIFLLLINGCKDSIQEESQLRIIVNNVASELGDLGFDINADEINLSLKSTQEMLDMYETSAQKGNHSKYNNEDADKRLAFYEPNSNTIVIKKNNVNKIDKSYLAHELIHAYQDQKWDYATIWQPYHDSMSEEKFNIINYLLEGHAELARIAYEEKYGSSNSKEKLSMNLAKMVFSECIICHEQKSSSMLPYILGLRFMGSLYKKGGWSLVENSITDLPASSEQILHPEKFQADEPSEVFLPVWKDNKFNAQLISDSQKGEAYLLSKLINLSLSSKEAFISSSGWDADRSQLYKMPNNQDILIWRLVFDRDEDAEQLETSLYKINAVGKRFRNGSTIDWVIADDDKVISALHIFLSQNPFLVTKKANDMKSTQNQEIQSKDDDFLIQSPYFRKSIKVESKN